MNIYMDIWNYIKNDLWKSNVMVANPELVQRKARYTTVRPGHPGLDGNDTVTTRVIFETEKKNYALASSIKAKRSAISLEDVLSTLC